jgi:DNA-binding beta-propeller fold protein YncE
MHVMKTIDAKIWIALVALLATIAPTLRAEKQKTYLETIHHHRTLISTLPSNGDMNPYAVVVAPATAGRIQRGDVLISNFNGLTNLQGTGTTIVDYNPTTKKLTTFASLPQRLPQCPGGVGLTTAMVMLKSGWVIVGSAPSTDGTTRTLGAGCLLVFDSNGKLATTWANDKIRCPWGNMAWIDKGDRATLFVSMVGFDVPPLQVRDPKTGYPVTVNKGTVWRLLLSIAEGQPPVVDDQTVIADGFGQRADRDVFLIGPTGLVLAEDGTTLYASNALANQIVSIADATTRTTSAGLGKPAAQDGFLRRPLAMVMAPNGNLLVLNAKNGQVVELNPKTGEQFGAQWIDNNPAQTPPGNGDLFGLAMKPDGSGFYYVQDDMNTLVEAVQ